MSYEDLEEAQATRAAKDAMKGKGKRGRKRKSVAREPGEPGAEPDVEPEMASAAKEVITGKKRRRPSRKCVVQEDRPEPEQEVTRTIEWPGPSRAPVARMY
ncbi:hypothetical protein BJ878DRAFT_527423 [Calycina marina]|uniref:Uncharacterized protein n=1 Tax=Calycina marina TaxID=1763456 RepID=A0A9P8CB60_9HELO|nr:hypothetical protein BJ878DRAFT_527423 [Calycina marina]